MNEKKKFNNDINKNEPTHEKQNKTFPTNQNNNNKKNISVAASYKPTQWENKILHKLS